MQVHYLQAPRLTLISEANLDYYLKMVTIDKRREKSSLEEGELGLGRVLIQVPREIAWRKFTAEGPPDPPLGMGAWGVGRGLGRGRLKQ